jgi:hypothetical protein
MIARPKSHHPSLDGCYTSSLLTVTAQFAADESFHAVVSIGSLFIRQESCRILDNISKPQANNHKMMIQTRAAFLIR